MSHNPRITKKELGLLKGSIRRVFSRSELRRAVVEAARIQHTDPSRPRVTKWVRCAECKKPTPAYLAQVDHMDPLVPIESTLENMDWNTLIDRAWCEANRLQILDKQCHNVKTKAENKLRREFKKGNKDAKAKGTKRSSKSNRERSTTRTSKRNSLRTAKKTCRFSN